MRVITGIARGCRLETLPGDSTRPTAERVKEGLFSAIQFDIPGRRVLDLFAGSGQFGIEALSRGAAACVFVDKNPQATEIVRRNLHTTKLAETAQVLTADAAAFLAHTQESFDMAFLDPPYAAELLPATLEALEPHMTPGGVIICESDNGQALPETVGRYHLFRTYRYGRVHLTVYR